MIVYAVKRGGGRKGLVLYGPRADISLPPCLIGCRLVSDSISDSRAEIVGYSSWYANHWFYTSINYYQMGSRDHTVHCYWHISIQFFSHLLLLSIHWHETFDWQKKNKTIDQNLNFRHHMFTKDPVTWMIAVRKNRIIDHFILTVHNHTQLYPTVPNCTQLYPTIFMYSCI